MYHLMSKMYLFIFYTNVIAGLALFPFILESLKEHWYFLCYIPLLCIFHIHSLRYAHFLYETNYSLYQTNYCIVAMENISFSEWNCTGYNMGHCKKVIPYEDTLVNIIIRNLYFLLTILQIWILTQWWHSLRKLQNSSLDPVTPV